MITLGTSARDCVNIEKSQIGYMDKPPIMMVILIGVRLLWTMSGGMTGKMLQVSNLDDWIQGWDWCVRLWIARI